MAVAAELTNRDSSVSAAVELTNIDSSVAAAVELTNIDSSMAAAVERHRPIWVGLVVMDSDANNYGSALSEWTL